MSTAVNKAGWMGQEFPSLTLWLLLANCQVAVRTLMYHRESRVLCKLIFVVFDWFGYI